MATFEIALTPTRQPQSQGHRQRLIKVLARGRGPQLAGLGVLLVASSALPLAGPQLLRAFIDQAAAGREVRLLAAIAAAFLAVSLLNQLLSIVVGYVSTHLAWVATNALREDVAKHALDLDLTFHDGHSPGEMIERTDGDVAALSTFMSSFVVQVVGSSLTLLGVLVVLFLEDWRIGLGMVAFVAIAALTIGRFRDFAVQPATERRAASATLFGEVEERLAGAEDLRANAGGHYAVRKFQQALAKFVRASIKASMATRTMWVVTAAVFAAGGVLSLVAGTLLFQAGTISLGTVYLLFRYLSLVRDPLEQISEQQQVAQEAIAGYARVQQLMDERPTILDTGTERLSAGALEVGLENVSFAYHSGSNVLHNIDLNLQPGRVLGVVGRTGSGKTTLTRLLLRLLDPTEGAVRIGGKDLRRLTMDSLRQHVALVTQDVQLFGATVRDNLTMFGAHDATDARLVEILEELGLGPWYHALPNGLDTMLGAEGAGVSAGEAQLLTFARVFIRDPGVVILDEATSRLDPVSEARIERAIDKLLEGRTAIIIAHRLGTLDRADEVVVLEAGRVVEHGDRQALVDRPASRFAMLRTTAAGGVLA
jgi:ATP-binding cassette subfamily B protein